MLVKLYNQNAEETGELDLEEKIFGLPFNPDLVYQVVVSMQANKRQPLAHAKDRSEVRGGGKKPWKQKGTGRARHGSIRSPIWVGGGVTHGPLKQKSYKKKINKKMRRKAFLVAISQKLRDNEILFLDKLVFQDIKTKTAKSVMDKFKTVNDFSRFGEKGGKILFSMDDYDMNVFLSFRNLPYAEIKEIKNINVVDLLASKYIVLTKKAIQEVRNKI